MTAEEDPARECRSLDGRVCSVLVLTVEMLISEAKEDPRTQCVSADSGSSLNDRYSILMKNAVMGNKGEAFHFRLCNKHSVKGVAMVEG